MRPDLWKEMLERAGVSFAPGLTSAQMSAVEEIHGFSFPEDLAELLRFALPVSGRWPDWRDPHAPALLEALAWPLEGTLFDIEHNAF